LIDRKQSFVGKFCISPPEVILANPHSITAKMANYNEGSVRTGRTHAYDKKGPGKPDPSRQPAFYSQPLLLHRDVEGVVAALH